MKLNITNYEYYRLIISFPFINTSTLVRIDTQDSHFRIPCICLMELNDYQIYKKQKAEKLFYNTQICEIIKNINYDKEEYKKISDEKKNKCKTHLNFNLYYLLPGSLLWNKLEYNNTNIH
jgi:hypothetical protein